MTQLAIWKTRIGSDRSNEIFCNVSSAFGAINSLSRNVQESNLKLARFSRLKEVGGVVVFKFFPSLTLHSS